MGAPRRERRLGIADGDLLGLAGIVRGKPVRMAMDGKNRCVRVRPLLCGLGFLCGLGVYVLDAVVIASTPKFFLAATQADFLKGDVENLSIDTTGQLTLGPATELVYETAAPFLWSMAAQPDGTDRNSTRL